MSWIFDEEVMAVLTAIIIVAIVFAGVQILNAGRVIEPFSELGLLGPEGKIGGYPRQITAGIPFKLNVYIGNREGKTVYYKVLIKIGDRESIINSTTPLNVESIMELKTILSHNSTIIIPIEITLYESKNNVRLVFEMWIYNETTGKFNYYNRWNQLWLNITKPPTIIIKPENKTLTSIEIEELIIEGYKAIRKAEENGGEISKMVEMINKAIKLIDYGKFSDAKKIINEVISMEPEISKMGIEIGRMRLYTNISILALIVILSVGCYTYLKNRIWIFWAKINGNQIVVWRGGEEKLSKLEKKIRDLVKNRELKLKEIVFSNQNNYRIQEIAKTMYRLNKNGIIKLLDKNLPKNYLKYFKSRYNLGFIIASILIMLCIVTIHTSSISPTIGALRIVLGSIFVLFLPGYALIEALYPKEDELTPLERLALSIGLSLALVPLIGLILNYTPWGIRLNPIVTSLSLLTLTLLLISTYRKYKLIELKVIAIESR